MQLVVEQEPAVFKYIINTSLNRRPILGSSRAVISRIHLAGAGDEIGKHRVHDLMLGGNGDDVADGHRAPGGQAFGAGIGAVIMGKCGVLDPPASGFADFRVIVQGAADRGLGQAQYCR